MVSHPAQPVLTLDGVTCYMFITTVTTGSDQHKLKAWGLSLQNHPQKVASGNKMEDNFVTHLLHSTGIGDLRPI